MRVLLLTALLALPVSAAPAPAPDRPILNPSERSELRHCPPTPAQLAADRARRSGRDLLHKLTELPPAQGFMAVYRLSDGCEDPMTMVEYRTGTRP